MFENVECRDTRDFLQEVVKEIGVKNIAIEDGCNILQHGVVVIFVDRVIDIKAMDLRILESFGSLERLVTNEFATYKELMEEMELVEVYDAGNSM